ncbi:MAG TPA: D-aminoacylase [Chthonomonadaceae bacterium]|nr:D-aminoacylase [Chthonomonadaceae bacterium]
MMRRWIPLFLLAALAAWTTALPAARQTAEPPPSILISGGMLVDGTGARRRQADVRIVGDHIQEIGRLRPRPGERVLDARGQVVAPGFIDTHSHADGGLLETPDAETQIRQGITTAVVGQDGGSHLPLQQYFSDLEARHVALNIASFAGQGTIRSLVMGKDNYKRHATPEEIAKMRALVEQEMQAGALGLSTGLEYDPSYYSTTEELIECAKGAAAHGGLYISHVRDEGNEAFTSFKELIRIAEKAHLPAQISHIKLGTAKVWGKAGDALRLIEDANKRGLDISADVYPYTYWQSTITVLTLSRDWDNRAVWEKALAEVGGPEHVLLSSYTPDAAWQGKTIAEIAKTTGRDPIAVIQEIVHKTHGPGAKGRESVVVTAMTEADVRRFIAAPRIMFCSDGGLRGSHPRGAGTFPRILGRYVREYHILSLEEAIRKMTSLPAHRMGFRDRGVLKPGMKADVVLFDPKTVLDTATTAHPTSPPIGLNTVLVNGAIVLDSGKLTGAHPGAVLRRTLTP